ERVLALERSHRLNGVCAANRADAGFRQSEVLDLACEHQVLDRARHVLDRAVRIVWMLIEEIDAGGVESLERGLSHCADVRRPAVEAALPAVLERKPELGRN